MPVIVLISVIPGKIRPELRAHWSSKQRAEGDVGSGLLDGSNDRVMPIEGVRVPELGRTQHDHPWRTLKIERVGPHVRIAERAPGLPGKEILVLSPKGTEVRGIPPE